MFVLAFYNHHGTAWSYNHDTGWESYETEFNAQAKGLETLYSIIHPKALKLKGIPLMPLAN